QPELYQVPYAGGRITQLLTVPAEHVDFSTDGRQMVYHDKKGGENEWRKYQQSSIARDVWLYNFDTGKHTQLTTFYGENRHPIFTDNDQSVYYLSEASGSFNVHKLRIGNPRKPEQLTHFKTHP